MSDDNGMAENEWTWTGEVPGLDVTHLRPSWPVAQPSRCPVCGGVGLVSAGFYEGWPIGSISVDTPKEPCRSCDGEGIVWWQDGRDDDCDDGNTDDEPAEPPPIDEGRPVACYYMCQPVGPYEEGVTPSGSTSTTWTTVDDDCDDGNDDATGPVTISGDDAVTLPPKTSITDAEALAMVERDEEGAPEGWRLFNSAQSEQVCWEKDEPGFTVKVRLMEDHVRWWWNVKCGVDPGRPGHAGTERRIKDAVAEVEDSLAYLKRMAVETAK
jgi:hypothetical protein